MDGACEIQLRRRQQRCRPGAGRSSHRGGHGRARARGQDARHLWPQQRPARLSSIARVPRRQAQADGGHCLRQRRDPDHLGLAAGDRPGQRPAAGAGRHRADRAGILSGLAEQADPARGQRRGHSARRGRDAHGCARGRARGATASRRPPQIHLHHPDRAESDRHHHGRGAPSRAAASCRKNTACRSSRTTATPT